LNHRHACLTRLAVLQRAVIGALVAVTALAGAQTYAQSAVTAARGAGPWAVAEELWDRPRAAEALRGQPSIRAAVGALGTTPGVSLVIRHGRGQNEQMKAEELRDWLVALAVDAARISLAGDDSSSGPLLLELRRPAGG